MGDARMLQDIPSPRNNFINDQFISKIVDNCFGNNLNRCYALQKSGGLTIQKSTKFGF